MSRLDVASATALIKTCPAYTETPIHTLSMDGVNVFAKDERERFGLGAFKALGGVYAVLRLVAERCPGSPIDPSAADFRATAADMTFVCASAGNHGMAVAAGAALCGSACRVHLARSVPQSFADRLAAKGATVIRSGDRYAEAVAAAVADGLIEGHVHLADGSWPGYVHEPHLVMEGYTVMADEMRRSFEQSGSWPDTVWLQAGVGGFAAAITSAIREHWSVQPNIMIVEPESQASVAAALNAGELTVVDGAETSMGRLDCEVASLLAFDIFKHADVRCTTITDAEVAKTVSKLSATAFATTPSGAAGLTACLREQSDNSRSLVVLTEAATID